MTSYQVLYEKALHLLDNMKVMLHRREYELILGCIHRTALKSRTREKIIEMHLRAYPGLLEEFRSLYKLVKEARKI